MTRLRVALVHALLFALVAGQAIAVATQRERWPFSPYAMYSRPRRHSVWSTVGVVGVAAGSGGVREVPLTLPEHFVPLKPLDVQYQVERLTRQLERDPTSDPSALRARVRALYGLYEAARRHGRHDGPALEAIRLYRLDWKLDPWVEKTDPDRRRLLIEFAVDGSSR